MRHDGEPGIHEPTQKEKDIKNSTGLLVRLTALYSNSDNKPGEHSMDIQKKKNLYTIPNETRDGETHVSYWRYRNINQMRAMNALSTGGHQSIPKAGVRVLGIPSMLRLLIECVLCARSFGVPLGAGECGVGE